MKTLIVLFLLVCNTRNSALQAQANLDSLRKANQDVKIATKWLVGTWVAKDSAYGKIEFEESSYGLLIQPRTLVNNYVFDKHKDSVFAIGTALHWPPHYCLLLPLGGNTVEILYWNGLSEQASRMVYTRVH
jgi:hypothetical protein